MQTFTFGFLTANGYIQYQQVVEATADKEIPLEILILAALIGLIPAVIAKNKGRSFGLWWLYGAAIFIVALPHALLAKPDNAGIELQQLSEGMKKCPHCAEMIKGEAKICRYCSKEV